MAIVYGYIKVKVLMCIAMADGGGRRGVKGASTSVFYSPSGFGRVESNLAALGVEYTSFC